MDLEEIKKLTEQGEEEYLEDLEKGCRPAFGSPGGKTYLAKTIVSYIPEHKTYVEPFVGGGAVFFAKEPSEIEVINDLDKEIAFAYKTIQKLTDNEIKQLKKMKWIGSPSFFKKLRESKPKTKLECLHKFLYITKFSYGKSRSKYFSKPDEGMEFQICDRLPIIRNRLRGIIVYNENYEQTIRRYNNKDAFFYLDPPYPGEERDDYSNKITIDMLKDSLKIIKGKKK